RLALALCLRSLALILTGVGRRDEAFVANGRSRDLLRTLAEADSADRRLRGEWAEGEMLYGMSLLAEQRVPEALAAVEGARAILEAAAGTPPAQEFVAGLADANGALALVLEGAGRRDEALAAHRRARDLGEILFRAAPENPTSSHELARNLGNLGVFLFG